MNVVDTNKVGMCSIYSCLDNAFVRSSHEEGPPLLVPNASASLHVNVVDTCLGSSQASDPNDDFFQGSTDCDQDTDDGSVSTGHVSLANVCNVGDVFKTHELAEPDSSATFTMQNVFPIGKVGCSEGNNATTAEPRREKGFSLPPQADSSKPPFSGPRAEMGGRGLSIQHTVPRSTVSGTAHARHHNEGDAARAQSPSCLRLSVGKPWLRGKGSGGRAVMGQLQEFCHDRHNT